MEASIRLSEHLNKLNIVVETKNYVKVIRITEDDIKVFNKEEAK